jgi:hypothetical protein
MAKMRTTAPATALALALAAPALDPSIAGAQPAPPGQPGAWSASEGRSADGRPICVLGALGSGGRSLQLEYTQGERRIVVRAAGPPWGVPAGARGRVHIFVDAALGWSAASERTRRDAAGVEWSIDLDELGRFEALFRSGTRITLDFPEGYEAPWRFGLAGADAMVGRFARCVGTINEADATRPHAGGASSGSGRPG